MGSAVDPTRTSEGLDADGAAQKHQQEQHKRMRVVLCERISDLVNSDALLRRRQPAEQDAEEKAVEAAGNSREVFNDFVSKRLMRIAERACVRGDDDRQAYRKEVLDIIKDMYGAQLVSQAFSRCLEKHCRKKMGTFNADAWRSEAKKWAEASGNCRDMDLSV